MGEGRSSRVGSRCAGGGALVEGAAPAHFAPDGDPPSGADRLESGGRGATDHKGVAIRPGTAGHGSVDGVQLLAAGESGGASPRWGEGGAGAGDFRHGLHAAQPFPLQRGPIGEGILAVQVPAIHVGRQLCGAGGERERAEIISEKGGECRLGSAFSGAVVAMRLAPGQKRLLTADSGKGK